jgi:hypothetical protein
VRLHHEMEVGYSRLVTISTDNMLLTNEYRTGVGAHWTFLSDPGRKLQKDLDIAEYTDPEHNPMIPHVIVLELGLVIFKIYDGYWFFGRPTIALHTRALPDQIRDVDGCLAACGVANVVRLPPVASVPRASPSIAPAALAASGVMFWRSS